MKRDHLQVRRSMMPVEAAAETLTASKLPVRKPAASGPCGSMRWVRFQSSSGRHSSSLTRWLSV